MTGRPCGDRGTSNKCVDVELGAAVPHARRHVVVEEHAGAGVGAHPALRPRVPQLLGERRELPRPLVPVGVVEIAAAPEVRPVEGIRARHGVPSGSPSRQVIEGRELTRQLVGLVEGRVERADQPDVLGDPRECGEDREGVGPTEHVELVDPTLVLAQSQPFGQEDVVEQPAFGGRGEVLEGGEVDLAACRRVGPHGGAVHAGKMGGEVDLADAAHSANSFSRT